MAKKGRRSTPKGNLPAVRILGPGPNAYDTRKVRTPSRGLLNRWKRCNDGQGASALEIKKARGRTPSLRFEQRRRIWALIIGSNPAQLQLDFGQLWTRKNIRELIRREFNVRMSEVQVGRVLRDLGLTPQRPLYRSYKQNPQLVEEWKKVIYPKIRSRAAEEGAEIFFGDEASVRTDHHSGTTWAPAGQTPVVRDSGKRHAAKMISAISPRGLLRFQVHLGSMNGPRFIEFLKALIGSVDAARIFLIVDGSSIHKSKKVWEFLGRDEVKE